MSVKFIANTPPSYDTSSTVSIPYEFQKDQQGPCQKDASLVKLDHLSNIHEGTIDE